jgi:NTP pyrophosphatase (non-canonical NTP hydrolase)
LDNETTVQDLKSQVEKFVRERDWQQFHDPKNLAIAIAIEAAELLELFRFRESQLNIDSQEMYNKIVEESMDILNFLLSLVNTMKKYPIKESYGNAKKYNELG